MSSTNKVPDGKRVAVASSGWLGFEQVFYNTHTNKVSNSIHEVIDYSDVEFDPNGLNDYLDFGYSAFGQTPVKNVHYLRSNETLWRDEAGGLFVRNEDDSAIDWLSKTTAESEAWEILHNSVVTWSEKDVRDRVLIPTSGGLDSRLLNYFYPSKNKVTACTYGISRDQGKSFEVVYGQAVATKLGVHWTQITLGNYHRYLPEWDELYGISTHAHGMYHWEFYSSIRELYGKMPMLSGIVGDAWAGSPKTEAPMCPDDLVSLGYSHGMAADSGFCLIPTKHENREAEFLAQKELLKSERYRVLYLVRSKMLLLSYLHNVPNKLGFSSYSPFLDKEVALRMLTVEPKRWRNRVWQYDFIRKHELDVEVKMKSQSRRNDLNFEAMKQVPLVCLDVSLLRELFDVRYLNWINANIDANRISVRFLRHIMGIRNVGGLMRRLGITESTLKAYFAYLVLKPIEEVLIKSRRDA